MYYSILKIGRNKMNRTKISKICFVLWGLLLISAIIVVSIGINNLSKSNEDPSISTDLLIFLGTQINESVYYEDLENGLLDSSCNDGLYILRSESGYIWTIKTDTNDTVQYILRVRS